MFHDTNVEVMSDLQGFLTTDQRRKIYYACDLTRDKVLIRLLWKSGRRISEILPLRVSHVDLERGMILWNILKKKRKYMRWHPIDSKTIQLLGYYIQKSGLRENDFLLHTGYPEEHMTRQRAFQIIRRICKKVGIDKVGNKKPHPHHFRHSFAIDLSKKLKHPSDVRKLQKIMEHSNLGVTEQYLQFADSEMRDLIEREDEE